MIMMHARLRWTDRRTDGQTTWQYRDDSFQRTYHVLKTLTYDHSLLQFRTSQSASFSCFEYTPNRPVTRRIAIEEHTRHK